MNELLLRDESLTPSETASLEPERQIAVVDTNRQPWETVPVAATTWEAGPLFPGDELQNFRGQWDKVQASFVDEPRQAVEKADSLVANVVQRIAEQFSAERQELEGKWEGGGEASTEDLRQALKRYRSFFERLLSV